MRPIEIRTRREALGLSQDDMSRLLGVSQPTLAQWESGERSPRDPVGVRGQIEDIAAVYAELVDRACDQVEETSAKVGSPHVRLFTYASDEAYWQADDDAAERGIPAALHRAATGAAAMDAEAEYEVLVEIRDAGPTCPCGAFTKKWELAVHRQGGEWPPVGRLGYEVPTYFYHPGKVRHLARDGEYLEG